MKKLLIGGCPPLRGGRGRWEGVFNLRNKLPVIFLTLSCLAFAQARKYPSFTLQAKFLYGGKPISGMTVKIYDRHLGGVMRTVSKYQDDKFILTFYPNNTFDSIKVFGDYPKVMAAGIPMSSEYFDIDPKYVLVFSKDGFKREVLFVNVCFDTRARDSIHKAEGEYIFRAELEYNMKPFDGRHADTVGVLAWNDGLKKFTLWNRAPMKRNPMNIAEGRKMVLQNVFFKSGSDAILPESYPELDGLADYLKQNAGTRIEISGHTDNTGDEAANRQLSAGRAKAVAQYLVAKGISAARITSQGYGSSRPVADNATEEGKKRNRRVEFVIGK